MIPKAPLTTAPEKELRFTRSGQAVWFWLGAVVGLAATVIILIAASGRLTEPDRIHPAWALPFATITWLCLRLALRLTRHAYLILTPLGIEIFPFFRPAKHMRVITWSEITEVESDKNLHRLTLHFNAEKTSGIHLSLRPIRQDIRPLLAIAAQKRISTPTP